MNDASGAPLARPYVTSVDPAWLDYNAHVTDAAYAEIAALANEELCVDIGMSEDYKRETGRAFYTTQLTVKYREQITADDEVQVRRTITRLGSTSMIVTAAFEVRGRTVATTEHVYVLVDVQAGGSSPIDDEERGRIEPLLGQAW